MEPLPKTSQLGVGKEAQVLLTRWEDVELRAWNIIEGGDVSLEVLRQDILRDMRHPVG